MRATSLWGFVFLAAIWPALPATAQAAEGAGGGGARLYVDAGATGASDGTSWADAFTDLRDALEQAAAGGLIAEIWVANGTYRPGRGSGDRAVSFRLPDGVAVYGGFAGGEAALGARDPAAHATILSGDLAIDDGPGFANRSDNCYHVVVAHKTGAGTLLDGFTITGGNAQGPWDQGFGDGGGICALDSSPRIVGCRFVENEAFERGGGAHLVGGAPQLIGCRFERNRSQTAGAMDIFGDGEMVVGCAFVGNEAVGGGAACGDGPFVNCVFCGNQAAWGGAILSGMTDTALINCTLYGNRARESGGAVHYGVEVHGVIRNSILFGNTALRGAQLAVYNDHWDTAVGIDHSLVEGGPAGTYYHADHPDPYTWGAGVIDDNPAFVAAGHWNDAGTADPADDVWVDGDCRVAVGSPCINAGDNSALPPDRLDLDGDGDTSEPLPVDCDGRPRIRGATADMGAYESPGAMPPPSRLYVDTEAAGANDGTSWADAFNDLQDALALARQWPGVVREIWVADGTYRPDRGSGDRAATFALVEGVALYGGFAGGETALGQHDVAANETILSGDLAGNDGPAFANNGENSYHVVLSTGTITSAILDGFTIEGGSANEVSVPWWYEDRQFGAGLLNNHGSPTVVNVTFRNNWSYEYGGGMYNRGGAPVVNNCTFIGNWARQHGGALVNYETETAFFCNLRFYGNQSNAMGSAIWNYAVEPTFVNCIFSGNTSAAVWNAGGDGTWINCTFVGNVGDGPAGAMLTDHTPNLVNCVFWDNSDRNGTGETSPVHIYMPDEAVIAHNCIQGWTGAWGGSGNIGLNPLFVDADGPDNVAGTEDDNPRLGPPSPCINAGDNAAVPAGIDTDLAGRPRIVGDAVDMGAYESEAAGAIPATIRIEPRTLNLKSVGQWVTCHIELPAGYDVRDIEITRLRLNGVVAAESHPTAVGDDDGDGVPDLMVKFSREALIAVLEPGEDVPMVVTGTVAGEAFEGMDAIRVINPGIGNQRVAPGQTLKFSADVLAEGLTGRVRYRALNLPPGARFNEHKGQVRWAPTAAQIGVYRDVTFTASDGTDEIVESITISVRPAGADGPGWNVELIGAYDTPGGAWDVFQAGALAYVADRESGLQILDVSNPASPTLRGAYDTPSHARAVCVRDTVAYVADYGGLQILNVADPSLPAFLAEYDLPEDEEDVFVADSLAYVAGGWSGFHAVDVSNPSQPAYVGTCETPGDGDGVTGAGSLAYHVSGGPTGAGLYIVDVANPAQPTLIGSFPTDGYARDVVLAGALAYVANGQDGLRIFDVSDPTSPAVRGVADTPGHSLGVCLASDLAYVADHTGGLRVFDVSDPSSPTLRGYYETPDAAYSVVVSGGLAYVACWESGLVILRFGEPEPEPVAATIRIEPRTLNLRSVGQAMTCHIELPEGYDVRDIEITSLRLNGVVAAESLPTAVGDDDGDGVPDLMVKFSREALIAVLEPGDDVPMVVTGTVAGEAFEGTDHIRVIRPGVGDKRAAPGETLGFRIDALAEGLRGPVSYAAEGLPDGASLDARTGWFTWTPTDRQTGVFVILFRASGRSEEVVETVTITIEAPPTGVRSGAWRSYR